MLKYFPLPDNHKSIKIFALFLTEVLINEFDRFYKNLHTVIGFIGLKLQHRQYIFKVRHFLNNNSGCKF